MSGDIEKENELDRLTCLVEEIMGESIHIQSTLNKWPSDRFPPDDECDIVFAREHPEIDLRQMAVFRLRATPKVIEIFGKHQQRNKEEYEKWCRKHGRDPYRN